MGEGKLYRMYFGDLVKIHSSLPVCSSELVYAVFMVENGRGTAYSSPVDWSLLGCHLIDQFQYLRMRGATSEYPAINLHILSTL